MESGCFTNTKHIEMTGKTYLSGTLLLCLVLTDHIKVLVGKPNPHPRRILSLWMRQLVITQELKASSYRGGSGGGSQGDTATPLSASAWR